VNTKGQPFHVQLTPGHRHEATVASALLDKSRGKAFIADAGYDSNALIDEAHAKGFKAVICPNRSRKWYRLKLDKKLYAKRFRVEVFFFRLKRFRAIATRYEKTARNYLGLLHLACMMLRLDDI
jgi:transposase